MGRLLPALALAVSVSLGAESGIRFRNVATDAGLDFVIENHPTDQKHLVETMAGGVAVFDYDGDGLTDIYFTNGAALPSLEKSDAKYRNRLYRNEGGMRFADVTEGAGVAGVGYTVGATAADYDNDGDVDLFVAGVRRNLLYRNEGDGTFQDVTTSAGIASGVWAEGGVWLDYDNDGLLDLFVLNYLQWTPDFDLFCGDRQLGVRAYCHPRFFDGLANVLYRNQGDGTFADVSAATGIKSLIGKGMSVAIADYDLDGFVDLFVTNDKIPNFLLHNLDGKGFEEVALLAGGALQDHGKPVSSMGADFRDYDNDGYPDIAFAALSGESFPLFRNDGAGMFLDATHASGIARLTYKRSGWSPGLFDFDNDGLKDLFTSNSHVNDTVSAFEASEYKLSNTVFANRGNGKFEDATQSSGLGRGTPLAHRGAGLADFNHDGRIDVVVASLGGPAELWENVSAGDNNWLIVKLRGIKSNRDGIGARVQIGDRHNHMTSSVGYVSSSHTGVHFGMGAATEAERIQIVWPSGVKQVLENVPANQILEVDER